MTVVDLTQPLADSTTLAELAFKAGISMAQARAFCAALADVPIRTSVRICTTAHRDRVRQINRDSRKR